MQATFEEDLEVLMGDLIVHWGLCNRTLFAIDLIEQGSGTVDAEAFARAVLLADGKNPEYEPGLVRDIKRLFTKRYGHTKMSIHDYQAN